MITTLAPRTAVQQLDYDLAHRHFLAEVSDTSGLGQVWNDSADEGLTVTGATGTEVTFVVTDVKRDAEGDLLYWTLASVTGHRPDGRWTMTLFND